MGDISVTEIEEVLHSHARPRFVIGDDRIDPGAGEILQRQDDDGNLVGE